MHATICYSHFLVVVPGNFLSISYLILGKPKCFQVQVSKGEREVLESIPGHVQHVELDAGPDLAGNVGKLILTEGQNT
jgi:hypothetical protein